MKKAILTINLISILFVLSLSARVLPQDVIWNSDESGYYTIKNNSIVLVSTVGKKDKDILTSSDVSGMEIESFFFSEDRKKVLIFTNSVKFFHNINKYRR